MFKRKNSYFQKIVSVHIFSLIYSARTEIASWKLCDLNYYCYSMLWSSKYNEVKEKNYVTNKFGECIEAIDYDNSKLSN